MHILESPAFLGVWGLVMGTAALLTPPVAVGMLGFVGVLVLSLARGLWGGMVAAAGSSLVILALFMFREGIGSWPLVASICIYFLTALGVGRTVDSAQRARARLAASEAQYRQLAESTEAILWEYDIDADRWTYVSPQVTRILGYSPEEWTDLESWIQRIHPLDRSWASQYCAECTKKGLDHTFEYRFIKKDGELAWVRDVVSVEMEGGVASRLRGSMIDITQLKQAGEALKESEERYQLISEMASDFAAVFRREPGGRVTVEWATPVIENVTGYSVEELRSMAAIVHPDDRESYIRRRDLLWERSITEDEVEYRIVTRQGEVRWVEDMARLLPGRPEEPVRMLRAIRDITQRKEAEITLQEHEEELAAIYENAPVVMLLVDSDRRVRKINGYAAISLSGRPVDQMVGLRGGEALGCLNALESPEGCGFGRECQRCVVRRTVLDTLETGASHHHVEACLPFKIEGRRVELFVLVSTTRLTVRDEPLVLVSLQDITERKRYEERLEYLSLHDELTGLNSRPYFESELARLEGSREYPITIISTDLDGLKIINDTMGHERGDALLERAATILRNAVRASDIVARTGGDEFAIILPRTDAGSGEEAGRRIRNLVEEYNRENPQLPLSMSIGIATSQNERVSLRKTFIRSDDLMYRDKLNSKNSARSYIVNALLATLSERDFVTQGHTERLSLLCRAVGERAGLSAQQLANLALLSEVHDLGKVGIPDSILFKKGPLDEEEWEVMRQHPLKGHRIAISSPDMVEVAELILKHHERWDGTGYPLGLAGTDIPIECRILAIVDAYDAITNDRPYRKARPREEAIQELQACRGTQFDPELVDLFVSVLEEQG